MKTIRNLLLTALASAGLAVSSYAGPVLQIWEFDGTNNNNVTIVNDNLSPDTDPFTGAVGWSGSFDGWNIHLATGFTVQGGSTPIIDLSGDVTSTGTHALGNTLKIFYGDSDFGPAVGTTLQGVITGHNLGYNPSIKFLGGYNDLNISTYGTAAAFTTFNTNPFTATIEGGIPDALVYALELQVEITNDTGAFSFTSLDASVNVPDSTSTALLIVLGLLGVGMAARRRR